MHTHQSQPAEKLSLPAQTGWKIRVPHISHISRSIDAIPQSLALLDQRLTAELASCVHSLSRIAPDLSRKVSSESSASSCLYSSAHINVFNRTAIKPLLERIEPLITGPVDSSQHDLCRASLNTIGRYRELHRTRSILQNRGALVFLRAIAERAWNLHEECLHIDSTKDKSCIAQNYLRQGASSIYSCNDDWFSRELFEQLAAKADRFLPFRPRALRSALFHQNLSHDLDKALRYESAIGVRGAHSGDRFDGRLAVLRKLLDASESRSPLVICSDAYSQTMVEGYLQSLTPGRASIVTSTLDVLKSLHDNEHAQAEKKEIYFVGIGPVTKEVLLYLQERPRLEKYSSATFLYFSGSTDEQYFQKSLAHLIVRP